LVQDEPLLDVTTVANESGHDRRLDVILEDAGGRVPSALVIARTDGLFVSSAMIGLSDASDTSPDAQGTPRFRHSKSAVLTVTQKHPSVKDFSWIFELKKDPTG
jgi:hypothetical protein